MNGYTFYYTWEVLLMEWLQAHIGLAGAAAASFFTLFGEDFFLVAVLGFLYWCYDKEYGKYVGVNLVVSAVWNPLVKNVVLRRRPYFDHAQIRCLRPVKSGADIYDIAAQGYSFPSGHAMSSMSAYGSLAFWKKKKGFAIVCGVIVFCVGVSRFCLGVHYPTDVLVGWALGALVIGVITWLQKKIKNHAVLYLLLLLTGIGGMFYCTTSDYFTCYGLMIGLFGGFLFEERYVNFKNTKDPCSCILRLIGGIGIFLILKTAMKLPFSESFLQDREGAEHLLRLVRYAFSSFMVIGVYPMLFDKGKRKKHKV